MTVPGPVDGHPDAVRRRDAPQEAIRFMATKMSPPQMLRFRVPRRRLLDSLGGALGGPLTLVCAGPGWGKTVLVSEWAQARGIRTAWLTLDRNDDVAQTFWSRVVASLRAAGALAADNPLAELRSIPADGIERGRYLARGLSLLPERTTLILDDFQDIRDPVLIGELAVLLRHPPPALHLVIISRTEPVLGLHRLRADGGLTEIRAGELAFTAPEATELLARHELTASRAELAAMLRRTEGWPAGLQLEAAFLARSGAARPALDGTDDVLPVAGYLAHEVLAGLPAERRRFLLYTSVCEHLCGELADAITHRTNGQRTLEDLERINSFVVRLGVKPRWFRYHHLLRDVLRQRLLLEDPAVVPELHRRAARWYASRNSILEALDHAVAARDWACLGRLVVRQTVPLILSANRAAVMKILRQIPAAESDSTAELIVCTAFLLFYAGDYDAIAARLSLARARLRGRPEPERLSVETTMRALELSVRRATGDMPALLRQATQLLTSLASVPFADVPSVPQYRAIALNNKGLGLIWTGRPDLGKRYLAAASTAARAAGVELVGVNATGHLALLEAMAGSIHQADRLARQSRELADRHGWLFAPQAVATHLALVLVCIERNDLTEAQLVHQRGLRAEFSEPVATQLMVSLGVQARLALALDEPARARALLEQAGRCRVRAPVLDRWLLLTESQVDLSTGRPERVEERYARLAAETELTFAERVVRARAMFALRDLQRAEELVAGPPAPTSETVATVEAAILTALIADARRHGLRAAESLAVAFTLANREDIRRPFRAMGGNRLPGLVSRYNLLHHIDEAFVAAILKDVSSTAVAPRPAYPAGQLSERQTEVLHYLPTMLSAGEIAVELGVSVNTVRAHMRTIYHKLDVGRRRQAVTRAREYGLL
jgi:LuxR family maltose regulon positive regulatory protein